ncbi:hypothetical protein LTR22_017157 [Elasticomyces elasticus]|nr:hypothetical protein LTR22_017157 [Elasticomyces elasticus]KAK4913333.1 hypothetical protein LTR49_018314 [Elasticomyces elasticus]KAK5769139.1 hypothetical protein LTS12_000490 [Elasticomyces elasticus]
MRLINIDTLEFAEFYDDAIPAYAILSHRWTTDELTYADFRKGRRKESIGYEKVLRLQEVTQQYNAWLQHGRNEAIVAEVRLTPEAAHRVKTLADKAEQPVKYMWLDTCCIDKRSSAELSEAINAMYSYYSIAQICFAHLADVHVIENIDHLSPEMEHMMQESVWFTRGWTLQEMIAPERILFCDDDWHFFAHKCKGTVQSIWSPEQKHHCNELPSSYHVNKVIAQITGVASEVISSATRQKGPFYKPTAFEIFRWASGRNTSRVEDMSYCLLGLLGINMPLLYGEGLLAFRRLQEAIMANTSDETFFAFHSVDTYNKAAPILAKSPRDFACINSWAPGHTVSVLRNGVALRGRRLSSNAVVNGSLRFTSEALRLHGPKGTLDLYAPEYWLVPVSVSVKAGNDKDAERMQFAVVLELSTNGSSLYRRVSSTRLPTKIDKYVVNMAYSYYHGNDWHICWWRRVWSYMKGSPIWSAEQQTFAIDLAP